MAFDRRDSRDSRGGGRGFGGGRSFGGGGRGFGDRPRPQMHEATCANCGKICQVPFRPTGEKPVYCSDCFEKMGGGESRGPRRDDRGPRRDFRPRNDSPRPSGPNLDEINAKLDKILSLLSDTGKLRDDAKASKNVEEEVAQLVKSVKAEKTIKPQKEATQEDVRIVEPVESPVEIAVPVEVTPTEELAN